MVHVPSLLRRAVGWSEIACAVALVAGLLPRPGRHLAVIAAGVLMANRIVAAYQPLVFRDIASLGET